MAFHSDSAPMNQDGITGDVAKGTLRLKVVLVSTYNGDSYAWLSGDVVLDRRSVFAVPLDCYELGDSTLAVGERADSLVLDLPRLGGGCGKLALVGRQVADTFAGRWEQRGFGAAPAGGRFRMVRAKPQGRAA